MTSEGSLLILEDLEKTLDISKWKDLDEKTKDEILAYIKRPEYKNRALKTIIGNYECKVPYPSYTYIYGTQDIYSCTIGNRQIYVFGDEHQPFSTDNVHCPEGSSRDITSFLDKVFTSTRVPIDFYIEGYPLTIDPKREYKHDIARVRKLVYECLIKDKKDCKYPAVRSHYIDLRQSKDYLPIAFGAYSVRDYNPEMLKKYLQADYEISKYLKELITLPQLEKSMKKVDNRYKHKIEEMYKKEIETTNKRLTEGDPDLTRAYNTIFYYIGKKDLIMDGKNLTRSLKYMYQNILNYVDLEDKNVYALVQTFWARVLKLLHQDLGFRLVDIYTLTRIFRSYAYNRDTISIVPKYIIIFCGRAHARNLKDIFIGMGATNFTEYKNLPSKDTHSVRCSTGLPQPLFTY